jgi:hypothetical protein
LLLLLEIENFLMIKIKTAALQRQDRR